MPLDPQTNADLARQQHQAENQPPPLEPDFPYQPKLTFDPFYYGVDREVEPEEKANG